ncbi:MAG: nicotinate (nicotinamide) nucleotide adenylyltransferase [Chlorobi bacterium]|nr:MAG: nicotinic acid mononucleotide adenylyltransferase [Chlorobi bacterium OLB7]MBK8912752.1 nicotinate (nicotinamide) nucleotide adenylyltransferase [Chlorobiota bacterium]MBX7216494.1 nicotinate-nucleotide adenylyltransferase [Candidatus Kapabacteria bacterium]
MISEPHLHQPAVPDWKESLRPLCGLRSVGVFGGTFDPVHTGHLLLAERACDELGLQGVLFVPAKKPPHKQQGVMISPPQDRLAMLQLAVADNPRFFVSDLELQREGVSFTVTTLQQLRQVLPGTALTLLIGGDNARDFASWWKPETIAQLADVAVWLRPGFQHPPELLPGVPYRTVPAPLMEISGTEIRGRVRHGHSVRYMTTDTVIHYINTHGLYR